MRLWYKQDLTLISLKHLENNYMAEKVSEIGVYINEIPSYIEIESISYENFFKIHIYNDEFTFFNILKKINILTNSNDIDPTYFKSYNVDVDIPWVVMSYKIYGTVNLWWLLCLINGVQDATKNPELGTTIRALKTQYINTIVNQINIQLRA
jgi:hypothetical protein